MNQDRDPTRPVCPEPRRHTPADTILRELGMPDGLITVSRGETRGGPETPCTSTGSQ